MSPMPVSGLCRISVTDDVRTMTGNEPQSLRQYLHTQLWMVDVMTSDRRARSETLSPRRTRVSVKACGSNPRSTRLGESNMRLAGRDLLPGGDRPHTQVAEFELEDRREHELDSAHARCAFVGSRVGVRARVANVRVGKSMTSSDTRGQVTRLPQRTHSPLDSLRSTRGDL